MMNNLFRGDLETISRVAVYPVAESMYEDRERLGCNKPGEYFNLRAVWTGEKRNPRKGEYYFSGAIIEAYYARSDMNTQFHIARLVRVEPTKLFRVVAA